ncbi:MAG: hypothetical protein DHS20C18_31920 [Saprospiraceae bacterium]|nr:MAG: hypothetical protein DHS20C18_31920 [Saprospiraceae bacterium]
MKELSIINDKEIKLMVIEKQIEMVTKEMEEAGESYYVNNPQTAYSDIGKITPDSPRIRYYNELLFLKKMILNHE